MLLLLSGVLYSTLNLVSAAAAAIHPSPAAFKKTRDEHRPTATAHKHLSPSRAFLIRGAEAGFNLAGSVSAVKVPTFKALPSQ